MSETEDISKLANILHQNGDKVLGALSKLSLNATLLQRINKEFELFFENDSNKDGNEFKVLSNGNTSSQVIQDLHFLYDFIQKTVGLKITNNANLSLLDNKIDVSKFKSIKYLEIKKVPMKEIVGLKGIQSQLETIVCIKCISKLEELLAECGGDKSAGFVWSELQEAVISYNNIKVLDTSIAFAPWLQVLDLSHNQLVNVKAIECLPNLKYINLSFNCLSAIPTFSKSARKRMLVLVVKNNYIEDLSGLAGLDHLTELDVSWNWVSNYDCLHPLLTMSALQNLSLKGNPIYYHKGHRHNVVGYLHISASFSDFVLDGKKLSKRDKSIVGYKLCQPNRSASSSPVGSVFFNSATVQSPVEENNTEKGSGKKSGKVRLAAIPNLDDGTYEEMPADISAINFKESLSTEHLITKKKIEDARAMYGSDWLRCEAASVVQDILGLPQSELITSTPLDDYCLQAALQAEDAVITTQAVIENHYNVNEEKSDKENLNSYTPNNEYPSNYYSLEDQDADLEGKKKDDVSKSKDTSPDIERIEESSEEAEDENEKVYIVSKITKMENNDSQSEELFLTLSDAELKEKDPNRGKIINKWTIRSLQSCTKLKSNRLQLTFDVLKRDRRERIYEMEESEAHELFKILTEILESRTLQDMNQVVYTCIACSSEFSKLINTRNPDIGTRCPVCNSNLILETDHHLPSEKSIDVKPSPAKVSHNRSSSAGIIQAFTGNTNDKVVKCSSQSSIGSAASLDEFNELPANQNMTVKRSESDIEILSNPSQSSIEVIDGPSRVGGSTPRRKRSSEERQVTQPLPEAVVHISNVGLTESSSSGSVTDSVCTAYENNPNMPIQKTDNNITVEDANEVVTKKGMKKFETVVEAEEVFEKQSLISRKRNDLISIDEIQYSFTDFKKVDHRIKLFLYSNIFENNSEEFSFIIRCTVFLTNSATYIESCIVSSNQKLYILKVIGPEQGDDASKFLQKTNSLRFNLKSVKSISVLPWNQGFSVKLQNSRDKLKEFLLLVKDHKRTQYFLQFLKSNDLFLPENCQIETDPSQKPILAMQHLLVSGASEDSNIHYFSMVPFCSVISSPDEKEIKSMAVLTTATDILLFNSEPMWLYDGADQPPQPVFSQKLSNLMSVEVENTRVSLQFVNELEKKDEVWDLVMKTKDGAGELIDAIKLPWEEMFSVPLQVSDTSYEL